MPDGAPSLAHQMDYAVTSVRDFFVSELRGITLTSSELRSLYAKRDFSTGFRIEAEFGADRRKLDLLLPADFPFAAPRVALVDPPEFLTWPHIEKDGILCLLPPTTTIDVTDPVGQVRSQLSDACELVAACIRGELCEDFQDEFSSYWNWTCTPNAPYFLSLAAAQPPSREVALWRGEEFYVIADDERRLHRWLDNRSGVDKKRRIDRAWLLWLPRPLLPDEYPKTAADVAGLASRAEAAKEFLETLSKGLPDNINIVFAAHTKNGPCFFAVKVPAPAGTRKSKGGRGRTVDGFRRGYVPPSVASGLYWHSSTRVIRSEVSRADAPWIHGRGRDERQPLLAAAHVVLIGCGSVGAPVAGGLAMAGVGRLTLIDPEALTFANAGRHPLGVSHVPQNKADAIATGLGRRFPHHQFEAQKTSWQVVLRIQPELLESADLIVSAMGDWNSESQLDRWHSDHDQSPPIVYGWTEPHACAGHAVAIMSGGNACFACGFDRLGSPRLRVAEWSRSTTQQEPGCGAIFQPYGPTELSHTTTLVAELAIDVLLGNARRAEHRIWACREQFLRAAGGNWTPEWIQLANGRSEGAFELHHSWDYSGCVRCAAR